MASLQELQDALRNADAAGDAEAARKLADAIVAKRGKPESDVFTGALQAVNQGLSFGFADEIVSGLSTGLGYNPQRGEYLDYSRPLGESYRQNLAAERGHLKQFRAEHPNVAMGAEVMGAAPYALAAGASPAVIRSGATLGGNVARSGSTASLYGAGYGFGQGEGGFEPRTQSAGRNAIIGALLGGGIPVAGYAGGKAYQTVANRALASLGSKEAGASLGSRKVVEALMRDKPTMSRQGAITRARRRAQIMGPEAGLMDTGENARALTGAVSRMPGRGKTELMQRLRDRQEGTRTPMRVLQGGQAGRVDQALDDVTTRQSGLAAQRSLKAQQKAAKDPLYERTANDPTKMVPEEKFAGVVQSEPGIAEQIARVKKDKWQKLSNMPDNSLPVIDAAQKRMSDLANTAYRTGATHEGNLISDARRRLVAAADDAFPEYAQAREVWRDFKGVMDADDLGRKFMRGDVDVLEDAVERMKPEELEQFRAGVVRALRDKIGGKVVRGDVTKAIKGVPDLEKKLQTAFRDPKIFKRYIRNLEGEEAMFETYVEGLKGSQTQPRKQADADLRGDPGMAADAARGLLQDPFNPIQWGRSLSRGIGKAIDYAARPPESARAEMARLLAGQDTAPLMKTLEEIGVSAEARKRLARALLTSELATQ